MPCRARARVWSKCALWVVRGAALLALVCSAGVSRGRARVFRGAALLALGPRAHRGNKHPILLHVLHVPHQPRAPGVPPLATRVRGTRVRKEGTALARAPARPRTAAPPPPPRAPAHRCPPRAPAHRSPSHSIKRCCSCSHVIAYDHHHQLQSPAMAGLAALRRRPPPPPHPDLARAEPRNEPRNLPSSPRRRNPTNSARPRAHRPLNRPKRAPP